MDHYLKAARSFRRNGYYLHNGDKCVATLKKGQPFVDGPRWGGGIVYRGISRQRSLGYTLSDFMLLVNSDGGLMSSYFGMFRQNKLPLSCRPAVLSAVANMSGVTGYLHTSLNFQEAANFVGREGIFLVIQLPAGAGVYLPDFTDAFAEEQEVAIPGFIHKDEIVLALGVENGEVVELWLNKGTLTDAKNAIREFYAARASLAGLGTSTPEPPELSEITLYQSKEKLAPTFS